jgi:hypothetical protein
MPRKKSAIPHRQDDRPVTTLDALYTELNGELFAAALHCAHEVKLVWVDPKNAKGFLGRIHMKWSNQRPLRGSVVIEMRTGMTPRQTRKTLAHEMCHLAAAMEDGTLKHNGTFWKWMERIGYGKHHHFDGEKVGERDLYTQKSEARKAVWFWRKQPLGIKVFYMGGLYTLVDVQKRGTKALIAYGNGCRWWVPAVGLSTLVTA